MIAPPSTGTGCRYYQAPGGRITLGSVVLDVPVIYLTGTTPRAALLQPGSTPEQPMFTGRILFREAWSKARPDQRQVGVPILARGKLRPVVVLRRGDEEDDPIHERNVWVLPRYGDDDPPDPVRQRPGRTAGEFPNRFALPACGRFGLTKVGHLDFIQAVSLPRVVLQEGRHTCDLVPDVATALLAKFAAYVSGATG